MDKHISEYLVTTFPELFHEIHLRFELGDPYPNGSDERIKQVNYRVNTIFENLFSPNDELYILVKDWEGEDPMFGDTTPNYIYELVPELSLHTENLIQLRDDPEDKPIHFKQSIIKTQVKHINFRSIFAGITNYEQGREPSIGQSVYFIDMHRDIIFHMYDDRGCIISATSTETIQFLYQQFNDWLVDYWRNYFDKMFAY